jgi:hypothetical protein
MGKTLHFNGKENKISCKGQHDYRSVLKKQEYGEDKVVRSSGREKSGGHSSGKHNYKRFSVQHWERKIVPVQHWKRFFLSAATGPQLSEQSRSSNKWSFYLWLLTAWLTS